MIDDGDGLAGEVNLTGQPKVDEALRSLDGLEDVETAEHVARFEQVHHRLQEALAEAAREEGTGPEPPAAEVPTSPPGAAAPSAGDAGG